MLVSILIGLEQIFVSPSEESSTSPYIIFGILAFFALSYGVWLPYSSNKIHKQLKRLRESFDAEITQEKFSTTSSAGTGTMNWTDFHKYKVGKDMVLVYESDVSFHVFPKRWFSDDDYLTLLKTLKDALGKPKA